MTLEGPDGRSVVWQPNRLAARSGGVEVYRVEDMELRARDRIRWTRNDADLGLVNSQTAEVAAVKRSTVRFRLEDGRVIDLRPGDPQMRHMNRAWASTVRSRGHDRGHGSEPPESHHPEDLLRRDQPGRRPGRLRPACVVERPRSCNRGRCRQRSLHRRIFNNQVQRGSVGPWPVISLTPPPARPPGSAWSEFGTEWLVERGPFDKYRSMDG